MEKQRKRLEPLEWSKDPTAVIKGEEEEVLVSHLPPDLSFPLILPSIALSLPHLPTQCPFSSCHLTILHPWANCFPDILCTQSTISHVLFQDLYPLF